MDPLLEAKRPLVIKLEEKNELRNARCPWNELGFKKYENGKIYIIKSSGGEPYIGSTTLPLGIREGLHKQNGHLCSVKIHLEQPDFKMELLELFPCKSHEELIKRERYWTEKIKCCNKRRPYRSYREQIQYQTEYFRTDYWRDYHKDYNKKREFKIKLLKVLPFYMIKE